MSRPRTFDFDVALALHAAGWSIPKIARALNTHDACIRRIVDPAYNQAMQAANQRRYEAKKRPCKTCGAPISGWYKEGTGLCKPCLGKLATTSVRDTELRCSACQEWKPDEQFPVARRPIHRRGRHAVCRACNTALKAAWRANNPERARAYEREYKRRKEAA